LAFFSYVKASASITATNCGSIPSVAAPRVEGNSSQVGEHVRISKRGQIWHVNFQCRGKQVRRSLKTKSKKEAIRKALAFERELVNGDYQHQKRAPTLQSVINDYTAYLQAERRAERTLAKYQHCFRLVTQLLNSDESSPFLRLICALSTLSG
jgi:hypothetical protein